MKFKYFFLIVTGLTAGLIVTEVSLRLYQYFGDKQFFGSTPIRTTIQWQNNLITQKGWFVTPSGEYFNFIEPNSQGFFDREHKFEKSRDVYRIILLGDSFVASLQTPKDQTLGKLIEKKLNEDGLSKKFEVISFGLGDTGTAQQYLALKNFALNYSPDLVVHIFLSANDIKNNFPALQNDPYRPYVLLDKNNKLYVSLKQEKQESLFKKIFKKFRIVERLLLIRQQYLEGKLDPKLDYPIDYYVYNKVYTKDYLEAWETTKVIILESKKQVEYKNAKYLLVTAVNNEQVNTDVWSELKKKYPKLINQTDLEKPDKLINEFCKQKKLDCLFMLANFRNYIKLHPNERTHYKFDGHWNKIGTNLAARILADYIGNFLENQ